MPGQGLIFPVSEDECLEGENQPSAASPSSPPQGHLWGPDGAPWSCSCSSVTLTPTLLRALVSPLMQSRAQVSHLSAIWARAHAFTRPGGGGWGLTPQPQQLRPRSSRRGEARARWCASPACQVTGSRPAPCTWRAHTLIDTAPGLPLGGCWKGRGQAGWREGQAEEVGFGKPSLNHSGLGQRPSLGGCQALADKGPGGRMNHQALSASFVLGWRARGAGPALTRPS